MQSDSRRDAKLTSGSESNKLTEINEKKDSQNKYKAVAHIAQENSKNKLTRIEEN